MIELIASAAILSAVGAAANRLRRPSTEDLRNRAAVDEMMHYQAASDRLRSLTIETARRIERVKR